MLTVLTAPEPEFAEGSDDSSRNSSCTYLSRLSEESEPNQSEENESNNAGQRSALVTCDLLLCEPALS